MEWREEDKVRWRGGLRQEEILGIRRVGGFEMGRAKKERKHVGECGVVL